MEKKLKLHALPTDKGDLIYFSDTKEWKYGKGEERSEYAENKPHHLYLTSDEEIKEQGTWVIDIDTYKLHQLGKSWDSRQRKIVATTNPDIRILQPRDKHGYKVAAPLPKIPQSLIEYFVKQQGNVKEVLVEWEEWNQSTTWEFDEPEISQPQLNSAGEIQWIPIEEKSYSREEMNDAVLQAGIELMNHKLKTEEWMSVSQLQAWFDKMYPPQ